MLSFNVETCINSKRICTTESRSHKGKALWGGGGREEGGMKSLNGKAAMNCRTPKRAEFARGISSIFGVEW